MNIMIRLIAAVALAAAPGLTTRATAAGSFDGTYAGQQTQTQNSNRGGYCHDITRPTRLTIQNNVVSYSWGNVPLGGPVAADGSFSSSKPGWPGSPNFTFTGRVTGPALEADVGNTTCGAHLSLKKV
jgi:hypothetical protein